ncbi:DNA repair protein RadA [Candidatus Obscuribacterales bacterium]|nr:DNA repair protein RadA [Candidatus Obscuribacterales bacterium]MBX3151624.1 DNA repair protein RadA [Candidatus Obscuribacterales bacterium]
MAKARSRWTCQGCGFQTSGFLGRCTECGSWGSMVEEVSSLDSQSAFSKNVTRSVLSSDGQESTKPTLLQDLKASHSERIFTGIPGLDEVLGGGFVPGAVILLAGDPGIGKSTLLLQVARHVSAEKEVLYVAGEESAMQVKLRASRLNMQDSRVHVDTQQDSVKISETMQEFSNGVAIIDSIQSIFHRDITSAAGSVSQVRESAQIIINSAKAANIATILVGHVTKEGSIAGPRILEHMVDVVLHFEGDRTRQLRILRPNKNRFGSTSEIAIFSMTEGGLNEVGNPSEFLLGDRLNKMGSKQAPSGTAVIATGEGTRTLLLEVQALVSVTTYSAPRRLANGWDSNRLLQLIAVLEKKVGLGLARADIYVNIVGGIDIDDPAGDLGVGVAIATSLLDRSVDSSTIFIGEVGLTGEVRPVVMLEHRVKEAARLGFKRAIVPKCNLPINIRSKQMEVIGVETLTEALLIAMPGIDFSKSEKKKDDAVFAAAMQDKDFPLDMKPFM